MTFSMGMSFVRSLSSQTSHVPRQLYFADSDCLIEKCYRDFST